MTYASQGGSTAGIAAAIGKIFSENGAIADVRPVSEVRELSSYTAVVIGSAVHSGKWMPEATAFVENNKNTLKQIPTAIFQACMILATNNEQYRLMVPDWLAPLRAKIQPAVVESFAGALWPDQYAKLSEKLGLRIFLASIKLKAGDYRDWNAIRSWSERIYPLLCR